MGVATERPAPVVSKPKNYEVLTTSMPLVVAAEVHADAKVEDRSEAYIIRRILTAHYQPRLDAKLAAKSTKPKREHKLAA